MTSHKKQTHIYKQNAHYALALDIYLPEVSDIELPVVVYIHGGALVMGNRSIINGKEVDAVIDAGMAYVSVDYRLAPETKLMDIAKDVEDAIIWVREEGVRLYGFDKNCIAVSGKSAGGYLALLSGTFESPNKPNAIISFYGYGDILGDWYSKPSLHYLKQPLITEDESNKCIQQDIPTGSDFKGRFPLYLRSRQTGLWISLVSGYKPLEIGTALDSYCPIFNISTDFPPTLLLHGSTDTDVPVEQSKEMYVALTNAGIKAELVIVPDVEHGFDFDWSNKPDELGIVIRFLKKSLNGTVAVHMLESNLA